VDTQTDDANCGGCGTECIAFGDVGHCDQGECSPTWVDCGIQVGESCDDVCADLGQSCSLECGASAIAFVTVQECAQFEGGVLQDMKQCGHVWMMATEARCCCTQ
jgi:hypothetical protein